MKIHRPEILILFSLLFTLIIFIEKHRELMKRKERTHEKRGLMKNEKI
jgi:hypothetical protein